MKKAFLLILTIFSSLMSFGQTDDFKALFLPDSAELYLGYNFNKSAELEKILAEPGNQAFLNSFSKTYGSFFDSEKQYKTLMERNVDEWEMELFDVRNAQLALLKKDKATISPSLYTFLENEVKYNYWHLVFAYPIIRSNSDPKLTRLVSLPSVMVKNFKFEDIKDDNLLVSKSFRKLLPLAVTYFNSEERGFRKYSDMVEAMTNKAEYAQKHLKDDPLDFYLATLLESNKDRISSSSARYVISQIDNQSVRAQFKNGFVEEILKKEEADKAKAVTTAKAPKSKSAYPPLVDLTSKSFDFSKYKGKVVYVDFWASWCGPCRREFPFSKKMHESLSEKEKKNIVFLYISIDDDPEAWKKAVKSLELDEFENGHSMGGFASEVVQQYRITGIPRYMIIDKNGVIVKPDANRPSNPETITELLDLAK